MDVVSNNIEKIGGVVNVDSIAGEGTTMTIRIPLTLAIIDGMNIRVSNSTYTIPITSIKESFRAKEEDLITDPDGNEMIMVRGDCYPIIRIHKLFNIKDSITNISEGITIMVESEMNTVCLFADELLGEQQVVVKALPQYIKKVKYSGMYASWGRYNKPYS
jgi:two-component system chemotaxis sensor kinase CheA